MKLIVTYKAKVYSTTDKKKLSNGSSKTYMYGAINLRTPQLKAFVGKKVIVKVFNDETEGRK